MVIGERSKKGRAEKKFPFLETESTENEGKVLFLRVENSRVVSSIFQ